MLNDPRDDIRKIVEWHVMCTHNEYQVLPCNFVPLIVGPSGSGKTYTIKQAIREYEEIINAERGSKQPELYIPFVEIDATQLSAENWEGQSLSKSIHEKLENPEHAEMAIIYIDEIDKMAMRGDKNHNEVNRTIQSNFLKWLDPNGRAVMKLGRGMNLEVSTAQMTFIFSGAFEDLFERKSLDTKAMGFNADVKSYDPLKLYDQKITWQDIKNYGLMPELVNRFNILLQTRPYTKPQLKKIARQSYDRMFIEEMLKVKVNDAKVVDSAVKDKSGARGINKALYGEALRKYKLQGKNLKT